MAVLPGAVVDVVVSRGAAALEDADGDGDGQLSFTEASAAVPGLTHDVFDTIDSDSDGQLGAAQDGCRGCSGAKSRGAVGGVSPWSPLDGGLPAYGGLARLWRACPSPAGLSVMGGQVPPLQGSFLLGC